MAEVLPLPHRTPAPYTLGEAVAELAAYAQASGPSQWTKKHAIDTRESLRAEIREQETTLGTRLRASTTPMLEELQAADDDPVAVAAVATRLATSWHSESAIVDAFDDLCDLAKVPGSTSRVLRNRSAILASQIGPAAEHAFSPLRDAADALVKNEQELAWRSDVPLTLPLTEAARLDRAKEILVDAPTGQVTVWAVYHRAVVSGLRVVAGPITFLNAAWALPNASFPMRSLRRIRQAIADTMSPATADGRFVQMRDGLERTIDRIHATAPDARILIIDYLTILPPDASTDTSPLPASIAVWGRDTASRLSAALNDVASSSVAEFVPAGLDSREHHAWAAEPWTRRFHLSLRNGAPYHPTVAGMTAVTRMLTDTLLTR